MRVVVNLASESAGVELDELVRWAAAHCPVHDAVSRAIPCRLEVVREDA